MFEDERSFKFVHNVMSEMTEKYIEFKVLHYVQLEIKISYLQA